MTVMMKGDTIIIYTGKLQGKRNSVGEGLRFFDIYNPDGNGLGAVTF